MSQIGMPLPPPPVLPAGLNSQAVVVAANGDQSLPAVSPHPQSIVLWQRAFDFLSDGTVQLKARVSRDLETMSSTLANVPTNVMRPIVKLYRAALCTVAAHPFTHQVNGKVVQPLVIFLNTHVRPNASFVYQQYLQPTIQVTYQTFFEPPLQLVFTHCVQPAMEGAMETIIKPAQNAVVDFYQQLTAGVFVSDEDQWQRQQQLFDEEVSTESCEEDFSGLPALIEIDFSQDFSHLPPLIDHDDSSHSSDVHDD